MTQHLVKIGDFSKICQVSVKALRHWDKVNLLKPNITDENNGYRYYAIEQVATVNRILALRMMSLSLTEIGQLLHNNLSADDIRVMLKLKQTELQQKIDNAEMMLSAVESRLKTIEYRGAMPNYEVTLKAVPAMQIVAFREVVPTMAVLGDLLEEAYPYANNGTGTNLMAVFHDESYAMQHIDVQVGFPIDKHVATRIQLGDNREMTIQNLPEIELVASTVHHGSWLTLSEGYSHLGYWIKRQGYHIVGIGREVFHHIEWDTRPIMTVTELQFPVSL